jgi:hypothetical protein
MPPPPPVPAAVDVPPLPLVPPAPPVPLLPPVPPLALAPDLPAAPALPALLTLPPVAELPPPLSSSPPPHPFAATPKHVANTTLAKIRKRPLFISLPLRRGWARGQPEPERETRRRCDV